MQVLVQLTDPDRIILVAQPAGQVLAASKNASDLLLLLEATEKEKMLQHILGFTTPEAFENLLRLLQEKQEISGEVPSSHLLTEGSLEYVCRLVTYQDMLFLCTEITGITGKALSLVTEDNYHSVFENCTEPLFILDKKGRFIDVNKRALALLDKKKKDVVGKSIFRNFGLNLFERVALKGQLQKVMSGNPQQFEWWLQEKGKDNDLLPVEILLEKGLFHGDDVILGSVRNLYQLIGTEQEIRFRNHQLEFVNDLITNLSTSDSQQEILDCTLDKLLEKCDIAAGCIYNYHPDSQKVTLSYSNGSVGNPVLPASISLQKSIIPKLLRADNQKTVTTLCNMLEKKLKRKLTIVPIVTEKKLIALIILWPKGEAKMPQSFLALLNFIGSAIGNYIARHDLMQQLTYSEDKYKLLFESSYDAILLFRDGVVVDCNEKTTQLFRCKREELLDQSLIHFSPEVQPSGELSTDKLEQSMQKALASNDPITFDWQNIRRDGTSFEAEISLNRIVIEGRYYVQAFMRDITQRKLAQSAQRQEEVMRESMAHFRNFLEKVNLIYYTLDTQGTIVYSNEYFLKYLEYEHDEVIGKDFFELLVPEQEREKRRRDYYKTITSKQLNAYYERDVLTKYGQVKTMRWNSMFDYGPNGEMLGITSVGKDMTDKRIAMEALKDNKIRLQDLFDNAHDLIQNISVDNKFIFVNKAWKDRLGYTDEDIESLTLNEIVHPYYKAKLIYQLRNLYKGEQVNKIETVFLTKAGKPVHLIGSINCSWQDGKPVATRAILHDITDRIKAERLQKVYYSIANLAISSKDLNSLYSAIHRELSKIIETRNIYIALCDKEYQHLQFVYLVDQFIDKANREPMHRPFSNGISEYIISTGKPLYAQKQELLQLAEENNIRIRGALPEVMLCSPLAIGDRIIGVIALQDYYSADAYVHADTEILHFISNQVALAIERKRNEEQINNQNARLNAIFESGTHHMWSVNRKFEITSFNRNFGKLLEKHGFSQIKAHKQLSPELLSIMPKEAFNFWRKKYEDAFTGIPQHFEVHLQDPESWSEVFLNPIYLEDASFEEISGIALDITDKKKSQLALANSEEKFRRIFESFQDVYYRSSLHGIVELVSPSITSLLGYKENEVLGFESKRFFADPADSEVLKKRVLEEKTIRDFEVEMITKDGAQKTVLLDSRLVYDKHGNPVSFEGVVRDVSELKRTQKALVKAKEEAENLLKVKTQFLANMSHELRTPMNGIIGMIDLLSQINTDQEQREYIDTLRKSSDALLDILNDILDLSKMQAGKLVINQSGIDLYDTMGKIHSLFAHRALQKDLTFTYHIAEGTPRYILTDETRFLQILSNLTSNAIKFTNEGEVSVWVDSAPLNKEEYMLHIRVRDSGIGISPEDQQLLFTDFTQLDNSSTKTFGGTGLGLAISKQITHLLGGDIGVDSEPGKGSTFWFRIKIKLADVAEVQAQLAKEQQSQEVKAFTDNPYILLVDDNQINQKVAEKQLERLGCRIDIASNGFEAIEQATTHTYDIIFMDIQMPEMDGVTAMKIIREKLKANCPPIVAMTAYSMKDDALKFISEGMDDYVSKPVKGTDLYSVISRWVNPDRQQVIAQPDPDGEATQPEPEQMIIDEQVVEQLKQIGGNDFTLQLYVEFEEEAAELLSEAQKELEAQHYKSILSTLHQLKGTGFTLGITPMAELAKQLEHDIKNDQLETVTDNFYKLVKQYETYKKSYKEIIS